MSKEDLIQKIENFIQRTGYPFEQRVTHTLRQNSWIVFSPVEYQYSTDQYRELDILAYKIINERRIELRISCKQSIDKHWIFFTEKNRYLRFGSDIKFTPVILDIEEYRNIPDILCELDLFKYNRRVTNFTAFSEKKNDEARALLKDGLYSTVNSVYHRIFPLELVFDQRGTIYFFITVFNGLMFESFFDAETNKDKVNEITYTQWRTELTLQSELKKLLQYDGQYVDYDNVIRNFDKSFMVEIIQWAYFNDYLKNIENVFSQLSSFNINKFGKPFTDEYFPRVSMNKPLGL